MVMLAHLPIQLSETVAEKKGETSSFPQQQGVSMEARNFRNPVPQPGRRNSFKKG
jgi:hypothetical protein